MTLFEQTMPQLQRMLEKKEIAITDVVETSLRRIAAVENHIQAFLLVDEERAYKQAQTLMSKKKTSVLFGMPMGLKDNIVTKDIRTTCASQMLLNFHPVYDATVVQKLAKAGAIMMGKLNMDEFAMGSSTEHSSFHPTKNPWDLAYVPGGSSGGSAAAVAAGEVMFALGSDTGGSVRQPASYCGVVGLKPTYGRVSRFGLVAFASSFDQIGPITRTVTDNAYVLQAIAGEDALDATSSARIVEDYSSALTGEIKGLRIAVPKEYIGEGVNDEVRQATYHALRTLEKLGATWEEVSLPHTSLALASYYIISSSEASSNLARFDGVHYGVRAAHTTVGELYEQSRRQGFGEEVKRRILMGTYMLGAGQYEAYYQKAQEVRMLVKQDFRNLFSEYDVIIGPTTPTTAFRFGEKIDPLTMYANDVLTIPVNLAGLPALSIPCGFNERGLPIGLQIIGDNFEEATLYRVAYAFEQATTFHKQRPI